MKTKRLFFNNLINKAKLRSTKVRRGINKDQLNQRSQNAGDPDLE